MNTHPSELLPAFVLGALDPDEAHLVVVHIDVCEQCRDEVRAFRAVVELLPYSATAYQPPIHIKRQLMARVEASRPQPVRVPAAAPRPTAAPRRFAMPQGLVAASSAVSRLSMVLMLLFLVATIGLGMLVMNTRSQLTAMQQYATNQTSVIQILSASDTRMHTFEAGSAQSQARIFTRPGTHDVVLIVQGMPQLAQGETYQCWLAATQTPVRACIFGVDNQGNAEIVVRAPLPIDTYKQIMVTRERSSNSTTPGDTMMLATLQ